MSHLHAFQQQNACMMRDHVAATKREVGIAAHGAARGEMKGNGEIRKVLVVDDDDQLAEVVRQVLRDAGIARALRADGFITKPFDMDDLVAVVVRALAVS